MGGPKESPVKTKTTRQTARHSRVTLPNSSVTGPYTDGKASPRLLVYTKDTRKSISPPREIRDAQSLIKGLRGVIQQKDREIYSMRTAKQGAEKGVGLPAKFKDEMNRVIDANVRLKAVVKELDSEVKVLKKVKKNQADTLAGASKIYQHRGI